MPSSDSALYGTANFYGIAEICGTADFCGAAHSYILYILEFTKLTPLNLLVCLLPMRARMSNVSDHK